MPHEIMARLHDSGLTSGYHWTFWVAVLAVFAAVFFVAWRFWVARSRRRE